MKFMKLNKHGRFAIVLEDGRSIQLRKFTEDTYGLAVNGKPVKDELSYMACKNGSLMIRCMDLTLFTGIGRNNKPYANIEVEEIPDDDPWNDAETEDEIPF